MSSRALQLAIDARPRGPRGLLAAELVHGRSVLSHLLDLARELGITTEPVAVHARPEEHGLLRELAAERDSGRLTYVTGPPRADAAVLRTDRLYDAARLRRALRRGRSPESAVLWRLDRPESLVAADEELTRRLTYQPLGKYWAFPMAEWLAERLRSTRVTPNALTLAAAAFMLSASALIAVAPGDWPDRSAVALSIALAVVLDTADGRLARLQGTSSAFGRWLDQVLDEWTDLALHAAIAWAMFSRDGRPIWLLLGIAYASGKYLFLVQSIHGDEIEGRTDGMGSPSVTSHRLGSGTRPGTRMTDRLASTVRLIGHADLRLHLWIVLGLLGRMDVALAAYAGYFPLRALAGAVRKGVRHA